MKLILVRFVRDQGRIRVGGGGGSGHTCPPELLKVGEGRNEFVSPHTFRHRATPLGTDCQTKSIFPIPIKM